MKKILFIICTLVFSTALQAIENDTIAPAPLEQEIPLTKEVADSAYSAQKYDLAIQTYEALLQKGVSATLYYNLGNSYFKADKLGKAIVSYKRAALLEPSNSDIQFNLQLAIRKTIDKIEPVREIFFVYWFAALRDMMSAHQWAVIGIVSFLLLLLSITIYLVMRRRNVRKIIFTATLLLLLVTVMANVMGSQRKSLLLSKDKGIVIISNVVAKSTPDQSGTDLFVLHEGHELTIKDNTIKGWVEVMLNNGNTGWIPVSSIEII